MKTVNMEVEGIKCGSCVNKISTHFLGLKSIEEVIVSLEDKTVTIRAEDEVSNMKMRNEIIELGFKVNSIKKI
ncbi:MAG: copper chaperone CopZ [Bacteriovoracaceae bacterium]|jgi:copper chaperone CopZ